MIANIDLRRLYMSHPTKGVSTVFTILFAFAFSLHVYQSIKYKAWRVNWLTPCCALIFVAGFICLEYNAFHPTAYAPSQGLVYSGAAVLSATYFAFLVYLIATQRETKKWWTTVSGTLYIFILSAVISLTAQGTANFFSPDADRTTAEANLQVLRAGVIVLLTTNLVSLLVLALFHRRMSQGLGRDDIKREVKIWIAVLYAMGLLLLVRNLFRTVQIFSAAGTDVWTSEALFWVFDATPLLVATFLLNLLLPILVSPARNVCAPSC